ncbi:MAG TPA: response regulator [Candidatus Methylomirabilis sp.]|nr:response regulator [Candidatus Methylomirabilis sp.]
MENEGREICVLAVDDDERSRSLLTLVLSDERCRVLTASNGVEAMELLRAEPVDFLITDYDMPQMNGLELIRHVKSCFSHVAVVLITGHEDPSVAAAARSSGVRRVFLKPFPIEELLAVVKAI